MEFLPDEAATLLSDTSDFTVIGILGAQGTGKSTLMSLLAGARWADAWQLHEPPLSPEALLSIREFRRNPDFAYDSLFPKFYEAVDTARPTPAHSAARRAA